MAGALVCIHTRADPATVAKVINVQICGFLNIMKNCALDLEDGPCNLFCINLLFSISLRRDGPKTR